MSHDSSHAAGHGSAGHGGDHHAPAPPPKPPRNGPSNCYGMPEKRFWRIVVTAASLTMAIVASAVVMVEV